MKKIGFLIITFMLSIMLVASPTYAAYVENDSDYLYDDYSSTVAGLTLTIDSDTQVFTVSGTMTATQAAFNFDYFTANDGGYYLLPTQDYLQVYTYLSGSTFEGSRLQLSNSYTSNPYGPDANTNITPDTYQETQGSLLNKNSTWYATQLIRFYGAIGDEFSLSFNVSFYEYNTETTSDIDLFDADYSTTLSTLNVDITANTGTIILSGSTSTDTIVNLTEQLNPNLDPNGVYLVKEIYVSGSLNTTTGLKFNPAILNNDSYSVTLQDDIKEYTNGQIVTGIDALSIDAYISTSVTYTNFTYQLLVEELQTPGSNDVDEITASDLGLTVAVYGNQIEVDDYFKFIIVGDTYQLVAKDDTYNIEFEGNHYVYLFNVLNNGTYGINISFGDDETNYSYQFQELNRSSGTMNWTLSPIGYSGSSTNPSVSISDLGDNTRQYNVYDDNVLKYSAASSYLYVAKWEGLFIDIPSSDIVEQSTVSYYIDAVVDSSLAVDLGSKLVKPEDPVKSGYTFIGWFDKDNNLWDFSANAVTTSTLDLYAHFVADTITVFNVYFDSNEGSAIDTRIIVDGELLTEPSDPILYGHVFEGWYTDEDLTAVYDFADAVTAEMTLYAKFVVGEFTITFVPNGGSDVDSITALYGAAIVKPGNPERTGYVFGGWYSDQSLSTPFTFNTMPGEDTTLYAKWTPASSGGFINIDDDTQITVQQMGIGIGVIALIVIAAVSANKKKNKNLKKGH